jgi:hypothetical protein
MTVDDFDVQNDTNPPLKYKKPSLPTISAMKSAIAASGVAASYPTATLNKATKNDLIYICRLHNISVAGL